MNDILGSRTTARPHGKGSDISASPWTTRRCSLLIRAINAHSPCTDDRRVFAFQGRTVLRYRGLSSALKIILIVIMAMPIGSTKAALIDRGQGLLYDTVLNVTWLADANFAYTSGYAATLAEDGLPMAPNRIYSNGRMGWDAAVVWADQLEFGGFSDWRLPAVIDSGPAGCQFAFAGSDCGDNVLTIDNASSVVFSELAFMYHVNLGLTSYRNADGSTRSDFGIFRNGTSCAAGNPCPSFSPPDTVELATIGPVFNLSSDAYWLGLEYSPDTRSAWSFSTYFGSQGATLDCCGKDAAFYAWAVRSGDVVTAPSPASFILFYWTLSLCLYRSHLSRLDRSDRLARGHRKWILLRMRCESGRCEHGVIPANTAGG
jgi:hypothetical protein